ncbi:MAG TPA: toll/interleukin-1 receptor domain-containing protein, partial [Candidatus Dormibacteraeota bacterium]|nr:toll/interleukin-1 receptor domain-containing protein [Candidatus Dormibacteraeota bacterium]
MDDVFISYSREDRTRVQGLVQALEARGLSIWIDHSDIPPGATFDDAIESALDAARCVIVVWTAHSVASRWVRSEASAALDRNRLVPVLFEPVPIPLEFRRVQTADLSHWRAGAPSEDFDRLLQSVQALLGRAESPAPPSLPPPAPRRGWWRLAVAGAALVAVALWLLLHRAEQA